MFTSPSEACTLNLSVFTAKSLETFKVLAAVIEPPTVILPVVVTVVADKSPTDEATLVITLAPKQTK